MARMDLDFAHADRMAIRDLFDITPSDAVYEDERVDFVEDEQVVIDALLERIIDVGGGDIVLVLRDEEQADKRIHAVLPANVPAKSRIAALVREARVAAAQLRTADLPRRVRVYGLLFYNQRPSAGVTTPNGINVQPVTGLAPLGP